MSRLVPAATFTAWLSVWLVAALSGPASRAADPSAPPNPAPVTGTVPASDRFDALVREVEAEYQLSEPTAGPEGEAAGDELRAARIQIEIMKQAVVEALGARAAAEARVELLRRDSEAEIARLRAARQAAEERIARLEADLEQAKRDARQLRAELTALTDAPDADSNRAAVVPSAFEDDVGDAPAKPLAGAPATGPVPMLSRAPAILPDEFQVGEIHFNPGSAELTPGGRRKTLEAAERIGSMDVRKIRVVGYADTAGDAELNKHLSLRRAASIADLLASVGLARDRIEIVGSGEDNVPEPTGDEISEPLNRCAGIYVVAAYPK